MNKTLSLALLGATMLAAMPHALQAHLTRIEVEKTTTDKAGDETLSGRFYGEVDPRDPRNAIITDLASAPRNARGMVEYSATFAITRPVGGSDVLFYDVPNRGNILRDPDPLPFVRVVSGWQGDLPEDAGLQTARVPVAKGLTGAVLARFVDMPAGSASLPIAGSIGRPTPRPLPVSLDTGKARLMRQRSDGAPLQAIRSSDWAFADCRQTPFPGQPDPTQICLRGGFDPQFAYTLTYQGKDPKVLGLGFAATRDLVAFLRHGDKDGAGNPNPVGKIAYALASGTSQSGNFLRSFINLGFNADEAGRRVFDGINPNIAARQVPLNLRFGVPGGAAGLFEPGSEGTLWWTRYKDSARGKGFSSLLDRCHASNTCPKVIETFGSAEFWGLRMSPGLIGTDGRADLPLPPEVRRYYFPSTTHGGSWTGGFPVKGDPVPAGCALAGNAISSMESLRAAQMMLLAWVREGKAPPPSRYPTLHAGDLVQASAKAMGWPDLAGAPVPDGKLNPFITYDFGAGYRTQDVSGILTRQPPRLTGTLSQRVPRVNADGNETSGIPAVALQVPLGTYTGWNVKAGGYGAGSGCGFAGGFIPFARSKVERLAAHDPRLSLEERYGTHAGFVQAVRQAVARQKAQGWLFEADGERLIAQAEASDVLRD
ncbi:hypothetical protein EOE18_07330 [Novosphingobium umbonatum]|uniref:Alpha/beta hydrolase domain-containing protein n=1 Tax=Novosphingobium umbonatum TaxID=1908524 RepID=A0A437N778_9SPHN|nr:alpha/beta hydrolase domain-containing protein [Novosphingobium umbonatum]RVU05785.1 hypothetical protein EOE18_07330 [Novosphingobium umbonatum]